MKIRIIIKHGKTDRIVFKFLVLATALWIFSSSFAPVKFEKIIVTDIPTNWRITIDEKNETTIRDYILKISNRKRLVATAYSSTRDQTDSTPFITAWNTRVRDGIVACNFLEFGTRILIPDAFNPNKVFTVEDRMAKKHNDKVDIWFKTRKAAKNFGKKELEIIVLAN